MSDAKLRDLRPDQQNANKHSERGRYMLERSVRKFGSREAITLDAKNNIVGGNHRHEVFGDVGIEQVEIIDADPRKVYALRYPDLDLDDPDNPARELSVALNRSAQTSIEFDPDVLLDYAVSGVDLNDWFTPTELPVLDWIQNPQEESDGDFFEMPLPEGVPDTIWPSDNEYGVPMLDAKRQADAFDLPIETWGAKKRGSKAGTLHFYTEDYRFRAIWNSPDDPLRSGAVNMVEPNFSVYKDFPRVVALYRTYQKRWLARYWQSMGIRIFVDLNVNPDYYDINLLGVPQGWRAYATRGYGDRLNYVEYELNVAQAHANGNGVLFMVYGGGKAVKEWCQLHAADGAVWVAEDMDRGKGRYLNELGSSQDG